MDGFRKRSNLGGTWYPCSLPLQNLTSSRTKATTTTQPPFLKTLRKSFRTDQHRSSADSMLDACPLCRPSTTTELRTIEDIIPTVRRSPPLINQSISNEENTGDGSYWVPHDDEALRLDAIAYVRTSLSYLILCVGAHVDYSWCL